MSRNLGGTYPLEADFETALPFWFRISHCPAPSIDGVDGKERADCLPASGGSEAAARRVSFHAFRPLQRVDAASIMLAVKAPIEARRAANARL